MLTVLSVILGTGYPKLEIFGYPGTGKQFLKNHVNNPECIK